MEKKKFSTADLIINLSGIPLCIIIFGSLFLISRCSIKTDEKTTDFADNNITIKEAPFLDVEYVKSRNSLATKYSLLKLDVNKNGVFDDEDVIIKTTDHLLKSKNADFPLEKNKKVIYFEHKDTNERGILAYQNKDNEYVENDHETFYSTKITKKLFDKLPEYMTDNKQR